MEIIEYEELKENFGISSNDEEATYKLRLEYSEINLIGFLLLKEKNSDNLILVIIPPLNGEKIIIKCNNLNELKLIANKIILNLEYFKANKGCTDIRVKNNINRKSIKLLNKTEFGVHSIEGTLIENESDLEIDGESLHGLEEIVPSLLERITTNEDAIDFSLMGYSLITKIELLKSLLEFPVEYTEEEIASINQYKAENGPAIYASRMLRKENIFYNDNFYLEEIRKFEKLFEKAPKLKKDIILYRGDNGENRNNECGVINLNTGFISFSIDSVVATFFASIYHGYTLYRMKLPKGNPCLILFNLERLEGEYINETEVLMPSFLYQVIGREDPKGSNLTKIDISFLGKVSITELLYERLKRAQQFPKLKLMNNKKEFIGNSPKNLLGYAQKGYNPIMTRGYNQLDIMDAIKFLYDRNLIAEIISNLYNIYHEELNDISEIYGFPHTQRVYFMAMLLAELDGLTVEEKRLLTAVVKYHDIGRECDCEDDKIGKKSADKLRTNIDRLKDFSKEEQELILFVIEQHSNSTSKIEEALLNLSQEKRDSYRKILNYFKDADLLDSPRLGTNKMIDINSLNFPTSKKLILLSYELDRYYEHIFNYIRELGARSSRMPDINDAIASIKQSGYRRTQPKLMEMARRILDGETISVRKKQISIESILGAINGINWTGAMDYFKKLLKKYQIDFKRGKKNGK